MPIPLGLPEAPFAAVSRRACGRSLMRALRSCRLSGIDIALIDQPMFEGLLQYLQPKVVVYRPTDVHDRGPMATAQQRLVPKVHGIVATSKVVLDTLDAPSDIPALVLENGVEFDRFAASTAAIRPAAVYVGALDDRFDWLAVSEMAEAASWAPFLLAGPIVGTRAPSLPPNVRLLGPLPYEDVPGLLRSATVGLLPLTSVSGNSGRSPMKYYEYLAAGLRVVGSATPTLTALEAPGVALYRSSAEARRLIVSQLNATSRNEAGTTFARGHDWASRASTLSGFLQDLFASAPRTASV